MYKRPKLPALGAIGPQGKPPSANEPGSPQRSPVTPSRSSSSLQASSLVDGPDEGSARSEPLRQVRRPCAVAHSGPHSDREHQQESLPTLVSAPEGSVSSPQKGSGRGSIAGSSHSGGSGGCGSTGASRVPSPVHSTVAPSSTSLSRRSSVVSTFSVHSGSLVAETLQHTHGLSSHDPRQLQASTPQDSRWAAPSDLGQMPLGPLPRSRERTVSLPGKKEREGSRASSSNCSGSRTPEPRKPGRCLPNTQLGGRLESASKELARLSNSAGSDGSEPGAAVATGVRNTAAPRSPTAAVVGGESMSASPKYNSGKMKQHRLDPLKPEEGWDGSSRGASPVDAGRIDLGQRRSPTASSQESTSPASPGSAHLPRRPKDTPPVDQGPRVRAKVQMLPEDQGEGAGSCGSASTAGGSSSSSASKALRNPRDRLRNGSRDDSFLSTISEGRSSSAESSSTQRDSKMMLLDGTTNIEVFSESAAHNHKEVGVLTSFSQLSEEYGEQMQQCLRSFGWEKPLDMQRRVVPLVMAACREEHKNFVTVQGAPQCGKTAALALGLQSAIEADSTGIRGVVLSTSTTAGFQKYFSICSEVHPARLECYESISRKVTFEGLPPDAESAMAGADPVEDLQRLSSALAFGAPALVFGHPARVLPLLREAPAWGLDLSNIQVLALDDAEETIRMGFMDEVCEVCTLLRHFSRQRLRHIILSQALTHEATSMIRCLRNSLLKQQNLFGIRAHRTQGRARSVNHYYAVGPRDRWPEMLAALHHTLALPSGIIFDDESAEARSRARAALRGLGVTASVWNGLQEQGSGARAAARESATPAASRGPSFHLMPSDLVVLKVDLPQVRCVLHFEVPRREISIYGLRLMCLEQGGQKASRKAGVGGRSVSVLFVEEEEVVRELEKTFGVRMQEVPTEMLVAGDF